MEKSRVNFKSKLIYSSPSWKSLVDTISAVTAHKCPQTSHWGPDLEKYLKHTHQKQIWRSLQCIESRDEYITFMILIRLHIEQESSLYYLHWSWKLQFTKNSVIWVWLYVRKFWKYCLKANIKGKFWGGDLEKPTHPNPPNRRVQYFNAIFLIIEKEFYCGVTKI